MQLKQLVLLLAALVLAAAVLASAAPFLEEVENCFEEHPKSTNCTKCCAKYYHMKGEIKPKLFPLRDYYGMVTYEVFRDTCYCSHGDA